MTERLELFWECLTQATPAGVKHALDAQRAALLGRTQQILDEAFARWPDFSITPTQFAAYLGSRLLTPDPKGGLERWFEHVRPADLYLAQACLAGDAAALASFEQHFARDLATLTRRFDGQRYRAEDLHQLLMEKLFVGPSAKISEYSGQGHLQNWLRVTATRTFIDVVRGDAQRKREELVDGEQLAQVAIDQLGGDLEVQFLKREYRAAFKQAFTKAMSELEGAHRLLLRQALVERMTSDQLGALYGIHRASAARRVERAREALLHGTRGALMDSLRIDTREFDSIMALIRSRLDVSMTRLLSESISRADEEEEQ